MAAVVVPVLLVSEAGKGPPAGWQRDHRVLVVALVALRKVFYAYVFPQPGAMAGTCVCRRQGCKVLAGIGGRVHSGLRGREKAGLPGELRVDRELLSSWELAFLFRTEHVIFHNYNSLQST